MTLFHIRDTYWRLAAGVIIGGSLVILFGLVLNWDLFCRILVLVFGSAIVGLGVYMMIRRLRAEGKFR